MANLQQFGGNQSSTTGQSSNHNPCKFAELKLSSHTWGLDAPPPSLRLADRKKKYRRNQRSSLSQAAAGRRTWRLRRSGRDWVLSLAPRLGGRPSLELHLRTRRYLLQVELGGSRPRPGPRGGNASHRQQGPYSITAPGAEAAATARTTARASASSI